MVANFKSQSLPVVLSLVPMSGSFSFRWQAKTSINLHETFAPIRFSSLRLAQITKLRALALFAFDRGRRLATSPFAPLLPA